MSIDYKHANLRKLLAWFTRVCVGTFILLLLILHLSDRSLDPLRVTISEYALGSEGPLMVAAFVILGIGTLGLALGLYLAIGGSKGATIDTLLLISVSVSMIFAGVFETDPVGGRASVSGTIHAVASLYGFTILIVAMVQWTREMETNPEMKMYSKGSARSTLISAILFVLFLLSGGLAAGLVQRVLISSLLLWQLQATQVVLAYR